MAPDAIAVAGPAAAEVAIKIARVFTVEHRAHIARDTANSYAWLVRRTNELCGTVVRATDDLFDFCPRSADWRSNPVPDERLSGFAADPSVSATERREAADALARYCSVAKSQSPYHRHRYACLAS